MVTISFDIVTNDICKSWDKSGKSTIEKLIQDRIDEGSTIYNWIGKTKDLRQIIYELTYQTLLGRCKAENLNLIVSSFKEKDENFCSDVVDVWSLIDAELSTIDERKKMKDKFIQLVSSFKDSIDAALLKERFDVETLKELKLIGDTKTFQQKYIKTKTRLFYKQQKFNLLREEMEGYSKLIAELGDLNEKRIKPEILLEIIKSLIGCFNIDPNRVLDLLLESFECHPEFSKTIFVPVLQEYLQLCERSTLCHLVGFKFSHYQKTSSTPSSLYTVAALLIQNDLVSLRDLLLHMTPDDESLKAKWSKYVDEVKEEARRSTVMILNPQDKKEDKESKAKADEIPPNQKFGLCEALLRIGDWKHAVEIMEMFEPNQVLSQKPISLALCQLLHYAIDPLYNKKSPGYRSTCPTIPPYHVTSKRVTNYHDLLTDNCTLFDMLLKLGCKTSHDPGLLVKVIRIGKNFFSEYYASSEEERKQLKRIFGNMLGLVSHVILPSLSLLLCNANISFEVWGLMKQLPYQIRYRIYGDWKNECYDSHPELMLARAGVIDKTKYIMRRLTKENVKQTGRQMGKLSHSSPCILFDSILSQIQRYDNLIGPVVDALKYLTDLTYDCLAFCIIEALANPQKERMKHDDTNISNWLQSLASFCGNILKKYSIELSGLLQYVANQLKAGKSLDLLILKEVVQKMSGIEISEEVTNDQLEALHGGELLKAEAGYFGQIRNTKKSSNRLKESLLSQNLALPLCILMAQQRTGIVFTESNDIHLKLMGKLADQCHDTLVQFGNFLSIQLGSDEYNKRFPSIEVLTSQYHTPPDAAFFLTKPMYQYQIATKYDELRKQERSKPKMTNGNSSSSSSSSNDKTQRYIAASEAVIGPLSQQVHQMHDSKIWLDISPRFYTTFWTLSLYDLQVPNEAYEREIAKLKQSIQALDSDSHDGRKRREKERYETLIIKLKDEEKKQEEHHSRVKARMKHERQQWFLAKTTKNDTITKFLQLCIFPRAIFSALDAVYCSKMIHMLHQLKTNNFSTLLCLDRIFTDISYTIASLTENESSRYGRFLCCMLGIIKKWHADKSLYEKECGNYPGFVTVLRANAGNGATKADQLDYENFRHVCHKWQYKLTKAIVVCLESQEFCQIRNALVILTKILPFFPAVTSLASALEKRIDKIRNEEKEKRPDLFALAMGYSGLLKGRKNSLVPEHIFHNKSQPKSANSGSTKAPTSNADKKSSNHNRSKSKETKSSSATKRKSEDKREKTPKENSSSKSADSKSKDAKDGAGGDSATSSGSKKSSSSSMQPPKSSNDRADSKRRKVETSSSTDASKDSGSSSARNSHGGNSDKRKEENEKRDGGGKRSISKERKRELPSPTQSSVESKRYRAENGSAVSRHSKEKESGKTRRSDGKSKKEHHSAADVKKERHSSKDRVGRRG